jgi:S1-C subfamily serine protease
MFGTPGGAPSDDGSAVTYPGPEPADPETGRESPTDEGQSHPAGRVRKTLGALLVAAVLFAAGLGIGWLVSSEPMIEPEPEAATATEPQDPVTTTTIEPEEQPAPPTTIERGDPQLAPVPDLESTEEPIADVAEALLPSMVQIEVPVAGSATAATRGGIGSGVVYDAGGLILTAAHVIQGQEEVTVRLSDGSRLSGTVLGSDAVNDIAVVQVAGEGLVPAPLALGVEIRAGQLAIAIGSPWGLDSTVTSGIVSAVDRPLTASDNATVGMIQTDAAINPGNSGGALVDRAGRVIGINVSIFTESGASDGVGFAVPIDRAYAVAEALVTGGEFVPGYIGISGTDADVGERPGALVNSVAPGEAASEAGIQANDVIIGINGRPVTSISDLAAKVREYQAGTTVTLQVERNDETIDVEVTLGSR